MHYHYQFSEGVLDINQMTNADSSKILDKIADFLPTDPKTGKVMTVKFISTNVIQLLFVPA